MLHADYKTASPLESLCPLLIEINKFCQSINVTNEELPCEFGNELLSGSSKGMEFDGLQRNLWNLFHILHVAERSSVKEVLYCIALYLFASKESHYITMNKSQQYTYHVNNTNKMYRSTCKFHSQRSQNDSNYIQSY